jgi:proline iminopeptidase
MLSLASSSRSKRVPRVIKLPLAVAALLASATVATHAFAHEVGVAHTPQVDIGYETFGERGGALPVIAVNGGPGLSHAYMLVNDMWLKVAKRRLVVFYDQRGTGASKHVQPGAPQTMDAQVADLEAVRAKLGLEKVAVVGDSYGGLLAMAYAAAHPEHVAKLVLSDSAPPTRSAMVHLLPQTFPDVEEQDEAEQKRLAGANAGDAGAAAAAKASLVNHFKMIFYSTEKRDAYLAQMGDLGFEPAVGAAVFGATADLDLTPKLAGFTSFPTLVISGRYDMNVAPLTAWRMAHQIPGARIVFFEASSHLPSYEEPEKYQAVLEAFLDEG